MFVSLRTSAAALVLTAVVFALAAGCSTKTPEEKYAEYLKSGLAYAEEEEWGKASIQFRNASRAMPEESEPIYQLALALMRQKKLTDAYAAARRVLRIEREHVGANLLAAQLQVRYGNEEELLESAEDLLEIVLGESPDNSEALFYLAATRARLGSPDKVEELLEKAVASTPEHLQSAIALARLRLTKGEPEVAEQILKQAVEKSEDKRPALLVLGRFYFDLGRDAEARANFEKLMEIDPEYGPGLLGLAAVHVRAGESDKAEELYRKVSRLPGEGYRPLYGQFLLISGRAEQAVTEFEGMLAEEPDNRAFRGLLVRAYLVGKQQDKAQELLDTTVENSPKDADARLQRAGLYVSLKLWDKATEDLKKALEFRPNAFEAHYLLSKVHQAQGHGLIERQELSEALRIRPEHLPARIDLTNALLRSGNRRSALDVLDEAPQGQKKSVQFRTARVWALIALENYRQARATVDQILEIRRTPETLIQDGLLKLQEGALEAARASLRESLEGNPFDLRALGGIVQSYRQQKEAARAIEEVRKHVEEHPDSVALQVFLGRVYQQAAYKSEARQAFQAAIDAGDRTHTARMALAGLDISDGKRDDARKQVEQVLAENEKHVQARQTLAMLQESAQEHEDAAANYRKILELAPDNVISLNNLAYRVATDGGDLNEALKYAQRAKEFAPQSPAVDDTIGWIYYLRGVYQQALIHLRAAVTGLPDNAPARYHLAMAQAKTGDLAGARRSYTDARKLDPAAPEAALAKKVLDQAQ